METRETKDEIVSIKVRQDRILARLRMINETQKETNELLKRLLKIEQDRDMRSMIR